MSFCKEKVKRVKRNSFCRFCTRFGHKSQSGSISNENDCFTCLSRQREEEVSSLSHSIHKNSFILHDLGCFCSNSFCITDFMSSIESSAYIVILPFLWRKRWISSPNLVEGSSRPFSALVIQSLLWVFTDLMVSLFLYILPSRLWRTNLPHVSDIFLIINMSRPLIVVFITERMEYVCVLRCERKDSNLPLNGQEWQLPFWLWRERSGFIPSFFQCDQQNECLYIKGL
jgi:hypothetical protein